MTDSAGTALADRAIAEAFDPRLVERITGEMKRPTRLPDFSDAPPILLFILFSSRAGSTYASRLLANTPYFRHVAESCNHVRLAKIRTEQELEDDGEALKWAIAQRGTKRCFGAKCGEFGLIAAWSLGLLGQLRDRTHFVMLRRRDRVAQAVSLFRADLSGRFHSMQKESRAVVADDYDHAAIAERLGVIEQVNANLERFLALYNRPAIYLDYEDICEDPAAYVAGVCDFLDLPVPAGIDTSVNVGTMRDDLSRQWAERYIAEAGRA